MTIIDLFNRALGMIGHDREIPADDATATTPTTEYVRCNREWDGARIAILSAHAWNWLVQETPLTQGADSLVAADSNAEGARNTPRSSISWKKRLNAAVSQASAPA